MIKLYVSLLLWSLYIGPVAAAPEFNCANQPTTDESILPYERECGLGTRYSNGDYCRHGTYRSEGGKQMYSYRVP
jgi:hypothetical protein